MTVLKSPKRRKMGTKRFDPTRLRDVLKDSRVWTVMGTVVKPDDTSSHYSIVQKGGKVVDVLVEVEVSPENIELTCRLGSFGQGAGTGLWAVPKVGAEVLVSIPGGKIDFMPTIVAVLTSGEAPERLTETRTVLVASGEVELEAPVIRLGKEATESVIHGDAFKTAYDSHIHPTPMGPSGVTTPLPPTALSPKVKVK